ncbi:hypothetical protein F5Y12DRAFT_398052 [Xylaria sp. FL1777]|nr:hypothetical protein F5Y12DRAFT_398052 [Xylaria sp. FL1777]
MSRTDDINPPCWIKDPLWKKHNPYSSVIYIVAQFNAIHRPLSIMTIQENDIDRFEVHQVVELCRRLSAILADPSNRVALVSELSLAADFYHGKDLPIQELPKSGPWEYITRLDRNEPVYRDFPEFPFVSTCLILAGGLFSDYPQQLQPLGTRFRDKNPSYGMVVFDISDLDQLRYGIVAFTVQPMILVETREIWQRWVDMDQELGGEREFWVEENRPRTPLSVKQFAAKFGVESVDDADALVGVRLVDPDVFRLIWPIDSLETGRGQISRALKQSRGSSNVVLGRRIEGVLQTSGFTLSMLNGMRKLRPFTSSLRSLLREKPEVFNHSEASGLLGLAFEAETHLNLVRYNGLSGMVLRAALDREELKQVQSISISIDQIEETPTQLVDALFPSGMKHNWYIFQSPTRNSDDRGIEFLRELCKVPDRLSPNKRIFISGIYSTALRRQPWIPASGPGLPTSAFPVHYIFHRRQTNPRRRLWSMRNIYIGDGMRSPMTFAAALLNWLGDSGPNVLAYAAGPPNLEDLSRSEVSPIPAEEYSRRRTQLQNITHKPLPIGTWCVVVSTEIYFRNVTQEVNLRTGRFTYSEAQYVKFALVRLLVDVEPQVPPTPLTSEHVQVCGLLEFLAQTSPTPVDAALVERQFLKVGEQISQWYQQGRLPRDMQWLGELEVEEAVEVLNQRLTV